MSYIYPIFAIYFFNNTNSRFYTMAKSHLVNFDLTMPKQYLSIGEVAEKFQVSVDLLRKWERDFPQYLRPKRTAGDTRLYDERCVHRVAAIYRLMRIEGLSVEGAKRRLKGDDLSVEENRQQVIARLQQLRQRLMGIVEELGN